MGFQVASTSPTTRTLTPHGVARHHLALEEELRCAAASDGSIEFPSPISSDISIKRPR
jgi:hypothetical protein